MSSHSRSKYEGTVSSSLLDILIKTEESIDEQDSLESIGNIGDEVIDQLSGAMELGQDWMQNALKMSSDVMGYMIQPKSVPNPSSRKQTRLQRTTSPLPLPSCLAPLQESTTKKFHKRDMKDGFSPRTKFDSACSELFQAGQTSDSQLLLLHQKLEKERSQQFENLVNKDVERLLNSAKRIYGPMEWTTEQKSEFANYCRNLRSGSLSEKDKKSLQNFYAKAYQQNSLTSDQEDVKEMLAAKSAIHFPGQHKAFKREETEMLHVKEEVKEEVEDVEEGEVFTQSTITPLEFQSTLDPAQIGNFDPGTKYEKEKEFRFAANNIFSDVVNERLRQQNSIPMAADRWTAREIGLKEDLRTLTMKFNQLMKDEEKKWTSVEMVHLKGYLDMFKDKMHFTIIQTKDLGMFLRKTYGRLQQYEIERENDTALQEKRKYWQEYRKAHVPVKKEKAVKAHPTRPYVKTNMSNKGETNEAKRLRKAAYLRQWRLAQKEKQFYTNMFGSTVQIPKGSS